MIITGDLNIRGAKVKLTDVINHRVSYYEPLIGYPQAFYDLNYDMIEMYIVGDMQKTFLGSRKDQACRFSGKKKGETSFKDEAYAIPEMLGSKILFTHYECDECNHYFGNTAEHQLGAYLKPYRTVAAMLGKKNSLCMIDENAGYRITSNKNGIQIEHNGLIDAFSVDAEAKSGRFTLPRDPYTPAQVYKAFVKMGLSVLPQSEVEHFRETLEWVRYGKNYSFAPYLVAETFIAGWHPLKGLATFVLRRKYKKRELPYLMYVISFANLSIQIAIPCPQKDSHIYGKTISFQCFPTPFEDGIDGHSVGHRTIDFSETDKCNGEPAEFHFGFDSVVRTKL